MDLVDQGLIAGSPDELKSMLSAPLTYRVIKTHKDMSDKTTHPERVFFITQNITASNVICLLHLQQKRLIFFKLYGKLSIILLTINIQFGHRNEEIFALTFHRNINL